MCTVLLVEDNPDVRDMMSLALELGGHRVLSAANGRDALALLHSKRPCVILLDLMMPIMDGWQFRAALEKCSACPDVPLIVISALSEMVRDVPADAYLAKPVDIDRMLELVEQYCRADHGGEREATAEAGRSDGLRP